MNVNKISINNVVLYYKKSYICSIKACKMIGKLPDRNQRNLFQPSLVDFIDMGHELVLLADKMT